MLLIYRRRPSHCKPLLVFHILSFAYFSFAVRYSGVSLCSRVVPWFCSSNGHGAGIVMRCGFLPTRYWFQIISVHFPGTDHIANCHIGNLERLDALRPWELIHETEQKLKVRAFFAPFIFPQIFINCPLVTCKLKIPLLELTFLRLGCNLIVPAARPRTYFVDITSRV